jgi:hypothetical protein
MRLNTIVAMTALATITISVVDIKKIWVYELTRIAALARK